MFKNKKIVIPLIVIVLVVVVATGIFIFIGMNSKNDKNKDSKIKFDEGTTSENTNNSVNETEKENDDSDDEIGADVEEFYRTAIKKFIAGYMDEDDMDTFLEDCLDSKAYLAYGNIDGDDSKFYDEYMSIPDDDEKIKEITETFKQLPQGYKMVFAFMDMMGSMAENMNSTNSTNTTDSDNTTVNMNITGNITDLSEEDKELKLVDIKEPVKSSGDNQITSIECTISLLGQEENLKMVFYGDTVIYICDKDGTSILEAASTGTDNGSNVDLFNSDDEE